MLKKLALMIVMATLAASAACSGNPNGPDPVAKCNDPKATNNGHVGTCVYPPAVNEIKFMSATPANGGTIPANNLVQVQASYAVTGIPSDDKVYAVAFLSHDGETEIAGAGGAQRLSDPGQLTGATTIVISPGTSTFHGSEYIILRIVQGPDPFKADKILAKTVQPWNLIK